MYKYISINFTNEKSAFKQIETIHPIANRQ